MQPDEAEFWRLKAALQELLGATDDEAATKEVDEALTAFARLTRKFRADKALKYKLETRAQLLKEIGVPMIGKKK